MKLGSSLHARSVGAPSLCARVHTRVAAHTHHARPWDNSGENCVSPPYEEHGPSICCSTRAKRVAACRPFDAKINSAYLVGLMASERPECAAIGSAVVCTEDLREQPYSRIPLRLFPHAQPFPASSPVVATACATTTSSTYCRCQCTCYCWLHTIRLSGRCYGIARSGMCCWHCKRTVEGRCRKSAGCGTAPAQHTLPQRGTSS